MIKITFSDEKQAGDIPTYEFNKEELFDGYKNNLQDLLELRNGKVIVCFQSWRDVPYESEHIDFFITNDDIQAWVYLEKTKDDVGSDFDFNFFCFENYEEAFNYCIDLKEGL